jgi:hypothetical protein
MHGRPPPHMRVETDPSGRCPLRAYPPTRRGHVDRHEYARYWHTRDSPAPSRIRDRSTVCMTGTSCLHARALPTSTVRVALEHRGEASPDGAAGERAEDGEPGRRPDRGGPRRRWARPRGRAQPAGPAGERVRHGETDALEVAGRLPAAVYRRSTMYTTLSPCDMCTGAILLSGIPRVVIGENRTFVGGEDYVRSRGVEDGQAPRSLERGHRGGLSSGSADEDGRPETGELDPSPGVAGSCRAVR